MKMAASPDHLFDSLQRLQPKLDAFNKSLSELCKANDNKAEILALRKDLEDYYGNLHKDLLSRYETLKQKGKNGNASIKMPKGEPEKKQEKKEENKEAKKEVEESFGGYSVPKILPVQIRPEMESLCKASDGAGLRNYLANDRKDHVLRRNELTAALSKAKDAAVLVLKAIEGLEFSESGFTSNEKKESHDPANRRACISLLECLFPILGRDENVVVAKGVQDKAREMARLWKKKMGLEKGLGTASRLDVQVFLQLLAAFRIGKDFGQDELCEMLLGISGLRQGPALALFLGLSSKMPDFVDKLSKSGKWIEAIRYAHAFGMVDKFNPINLVKAYLEGVEKALKDLVKKEGGSESSLYNSTMRETGSINMVIKVVKEYNLEDLYPLDDWQNILQRLEQAKEVRKRSAENKKQQNRANKNKAAADKAGKEASVDKAEKKAAASTPEKKKLIATAPEKKNKAVEAESDKKYASVEKEQLKWQRSFEPGSGNLGVIGAQGPADYASAEKEQFKRQRASEPGSGNLEIIGAQGPADLGPYRPSQRAKYASEWEMNSASGDKGMVPHGTGLGLLQSNHGISKDDRYPSLYHGDNRNAVGPSMYRSGHTGTFATPSPTATQNNERRGSDGYPSAFGSSNINPVKPSFYGSSTAAGSLAVSSLNPAQVNYDGRGLQSYTPAFDGVDKSPLGSSMYDIGDLENSSSSLVQSNYERRVPELKTSAFGGDGSSNIGSSVYGSKWSSDSNNQNERRGLERYMPTLGAGNMHPIDSSMYGSGASAVPSTNVYGSGASAVPSSNVYGSGASAGPSSNITQSNFEGRELEQHNSGFASSIRSDYGSAASAGGLTRQSALNRYQFNSGLRF